MSRARTYVGFAVIAALSVIGASCSSDAGTPRSSPSTTPAASATSPTNATDNALARYASLKRSDFPAGWTSRPGSKSYPVQTLTVLLERCSGVSASQLGQAPARYESPAFSHPNTGSASSTTGYRASAAEQKSIFAHLSGPKSSTCYKKAVQAITSHTKSSKNVGQPVSSPISFPTFGDATVAYRVAVPVSHSIVEITEYLDLIFSIKGRADALLFFLSVGQPFPADLEQHYTGLVVGRLKNT